MTFNFKSADRYLVLTDNYLMKREFTYLLLIKKTPYTENPLVNIIICLEPLFKYIAYTNSTYICTYIIYC